MKKLQTYLLIALVSISCSDWLDVSPQGQAKEADVYKTESGFQSVLTGVYISMADANLYGRQMTMRMPELLARNWQVYGTSISTPTDAYLRDYNFDNVSVKNTITAAWQSYYRTIVSLNSLLNAIDEKKAIFSDGNYALIKGEALGLRAFLHFDILRFWGPVPLGASLTEAAIPYVDEVTRDINKLQSLPYGKVLEKILADLNAAEVLLENDPITRYTPAALEGRTGAPYDDFHFYRKNRFNLYAVKATKARYYLWINRPEEAATHAREVIAAAVGSTKVFTLANSGTIVDDRTMGTEHVFSLHEPRFSSITSGFFDVRDCFQTDALLKQAFETTDHSNDIRSVGAWVEVVSPRTQIVFKKFFDPNTKTSATLMPLIRLAELYFIAMEGGTLVEANDLLEEFRAARIMSTVIQNSLLTPDDVRVRLEKEYRKDFYAEGQMFYYYKRFNVNPIVWPTSVDVVYQIPKPEQQTDFENTEK